jgi:hypothetical protein
MTTPAAVPAKDRNALPRHHFPGAVIVPHVWNFFASPQFCPIHFNGLGLASHVLTLKCETSSPRRAIQQLEA